MLRVYYFLSKILIKNLNNYKSVYHNFQSKLLLLLLLLLLGNLHLQAIQHIINFIRA